MARGVKIYGSGGLQIDNNYRNYTYYESGSYEVNVIDTVIPITPTSAAVVAAIRPGPDGTITNWGLTRTGSDYDGLIIKSDATQTIDYIVFRDGDSATVSGTYGLKIYRPDNSVAFDSRNKYMKLVEIHEISSDGGFTVNDADNNYFMLENFASKDNSYYYSGGQITYNWNSTGIKKINSTTLQVVILKIYSYTTSYAGGGTGNGYYSSGSSYPFNILEFEGV